MFDHTSLRVPTFICSLTDKVRGPKGPNNQGQCGAKAAALSPQSGPAKTICCTHGVKRLALSRESKLLHIHSKKDMKKKKTVLAYKA